MSTHENDTPSAEPSEPSNSAAATDKSLLLDDLDERFAAFQAFRKSDATQSESILNALGAQDDVDRDIVLELSAPQPLGHPDRFLKAHALAVRSLEVLDRNGARGVTVRGLGPLGPVAGFFIRQVAHFIVRSYQATVVDRMLWLYARREANADPNDPQRRLLTRARIHMQRLAPGFKRNPLGVPTFLLGGAVLSTLARLLLDAAGSATSSLWTQAAATIVVGLLIAGAAFVILRGAAVARRRILLTTDKPLSALWQTIGRCGEPPRDQARTIATLAIGLTFIPWVIIPLGLLLAWLTS
ncbi:MAG: hypothetical protein AAF467_16070 [Actinomycetota bacterium]